jgi:hypothetical protein
VWHLADDVDVATFTGSKAVGRTRILAGVDVPVVVIPRAGTDD